MRSARAAFAWGEQPFADLPGVLAEVGIDPALAVEADNPDRDIDIKNSMTDATAALGDGGAEPSIPILAIIEGPRRTGFHGPLLSGPVPDINAGEIWDAFITLARVSSVCELSRPRPAQPMTDAA